jgi:hypothetical protein
MVTTDQALASAEAAVPGQATVPPGQHD